MTLEEIYQNLCSHDQRNPIYKDIHIQDLPKDCYPEPRTNCRCLNCVYGKDKLALEILKLREELDAREDPIYQVTDFVR